MCHGEKLPSSRIYEGVRREERRVIITLVGGTLMKNIIDRTWYRIRHYCTNNYNNKRVQERNELVYATRFIVYSYVNEV